MGKAEPATLREVHSLLGDFRKEVTTRFDGIEGKVDTQISKTANIEGKIYFVPFLIGSAITVFGIVVNIVLVLTVK